MKKVIMTILSILIFIILMMTIYTIDGRNVRQTELNNALKLSMESAMDQLILADGNPQSEEEWKAMFVQSVVMQIDSASDLTVNILEADMDKGILSVEAVLTFRHPVGTKGRVAVQRTILLEEYLAY